MAKDYSFSGWATKANIRCTDGKIIMPNAFKDDDGKKVPLVFNHSHSRIDDVLGHAILEHRDQGVYAYCYLNDTAKGSNAKKLVTHGDLDSLSICAGELRHNGESIVKGSIKEVSLVLAGANSGAKIENIVFHTALGDEYESDEDAIISMGQDSKIIMHSDIENNEEVNYSDEIGDKTLEEVFETFNAEQKAAVAAMIALVLEDKNTGAGGGGGGGGSSDDDEDYNIEALSKEEIDEIVDKGGQNTMKHNVFESCNKEDEVLTHSEMATIFEDAKRNGSLKDAFISHGITEIHNLFPEAKEVDNTLKFIGQPGDWVTSVMNAVGKSPFPRVKTTFANITADEARARGYIKGKQKIEEVFTLLKRKTEPQTVYKLQKMDRDDIIDITDIDIVAAVKNEMRMMLQYEIARAIMVGDGRSAASDDKIHEDNIRPIWTDEDLFTVKAKFDASASMSSSDRAKEAIKTIIRARKEYKGSGRPTLYCSEDFIADCLLLEDNTGRSIYESEQQLATKLRVAGIVTSPIFDNQTREVDGKIHSLHALIVNLSDYKLGTAAGGQATMFDDFDLNFNKYEYLIETRCSGALITPYSAISVESVMPKIGGASLG